VSNFFYYLWRFILASMAWLAAVIVASFVLTTLLMASGSEGPVGQVAMENILQVSLTTTPIMVFYVATGTFIPSLFIIIWAEFAARRDWLFYSVAGLLTGIGIVGYGLYLNAQYQPWDYGLFAATVAVAGIVAGSIYWLIAGRSAGARR
jgi:hypothetical protein